VGELGRIAAAELQSHGMLSRMEAQMALDVAVQERAAGDHLRIHHRAAGELTEEIAAMPIGPIHHRGGTQPMR
jgi:hypothetical protein